MGRRMVRFNVTAELIRRALAMPEWTEIYDIKPWLRFTEDPKSVDVFTFYVEHPDLPEVKEGEQPPEIDPVIQADYDKEPGVWLTFNWGLEDKADS